MRTQGTYYIRGTEGRKDGRTEGRKDGWKDGRTEGRNAENYVPPLFFEKAGDKKHVKYCEKVYERSSKDLFWSIKNSGEILDKLKARDFNATSLSTYDFSTLYTTLPHNLIKDKLIDLIERTFQRAGSPYLACKDRNAFFTSGKP